MVRDLTTCVYCNVVRQASCVAPGLRHAGCLFFLCTFEELGALTGKEAKSLMRMFGPKGNTQARNLFDVIARLQAREGVHFHVHPSR